MSRIISTSSLANLFPCLPTFTQNFWMLLSINLTRTFLAAICDAPLLPFHIHPSSTYKPLKDVEDCKRNPHEPFFSSQKIKPALSTSLWESHAQVTWPSWGCSSTPTPLQWFLSCTGGPKLPQCVVHECCSTFCPQGHPGLFLAKLLYQIWQKWS